MWELLQRPVVQFGQRGHIADIARRGLSYGAPFLERRLFELLLGTSADALPRTSDTGQYKPLISTGLAAYMPAELTRVYWKVEFGSYNHSRMRIALDQIEEWLFTAGQWRSERFVSKRSAQGTLAAFRAAYDSGHVRTHEQLMRLYGIVGLEAWLRQL